MNKATMRAMGMSELHASEQRSAAAQDWFAEQSPESEAAIERLIAGPSRELAVAMLNNRALSDTIRFLAAAKYDELKQAAWNQVIGLPEEPSDGSETSVDD